MVSLSLFVVSKEVRLDDLDILLKLFVVLPCEELHFEFHVGSVRDLRVLNVNLVAVKVVLESEDKFLLNF